MLPALVDRQGGVTCRPHSVSSPNSWALKADTLGERWLMPLLSLIGQPTPCHLWVGTWVWMDVGFTCPKRPALKQRQLDYTLSWINQVIDQRSRSPDWISGSGLAVPRQSTVLTGLNTMEKLSRCRLHSFQVLISTQVLTAKEKESWGIQ